MPNLIGGQQIGPAAPAFNLGGIMPPVDRLSPEVGGLPAMLAQVMPQGGAENPVQDAQAGLPEREMMGPPEAQDDPLAGGGFFNSFFNNLDTNLQSPSKVLGLGLLNQINPNLALGGLLAGGLLGPQSFTR